MTNKTDCQGLGGEGHIHTCTPKVEVVLWINRGHFERLLNHTMRGAPVWRNKVDFDDIPFTFCRCKEPDAAQPVKEQPCNCRWDGDTQVQQCTLHAAHVEAIHEWAERAKTAEKELAHLAALSATAQPVQEQAEEKGEPPREVWVVSDGEGQADYVANWKEACHERASDLAEAAPELGPYRVCKYIAEPFAAHPANTQAQVSKERVFELANQHATSDPIDPGKVYSIFTDDGLVAFANALLSTQAQPVTLTDEEIERIIRDVSELPDRDSPEDWPEAMLVTADELREILLSASPAQAREQEIRKQVLEEAESTFDPESMYAITEHQAQQRIRSLKARALATDKEGE